MRHNDRKESGSIINVSVAPGAAKSEVAGVLDDGTLRVKVTAPPENGKANEQVCEVLANYFSVPKGCITIVKGATSRRKQVRVVEGRKKGPRQ